MSGPSGLLVQNIDEAQTVQASDYKEIYANNVRAGFSQWDVVLVFGRLKEMAKNTAGIEELMSVRMSPQQFKTLAVALPHMMTEWERRFGVVNIPTGAFDPELVRQMLVRAEQAAAAAATKAGQPETTAE